MQRPPGLNRTETAEFLSRRLGRTFYERVLRYWESLELVHPVKVNPGGRGRHCPVVYRLPELIGAEVLATLRLVDGVPLQRVRKALRELEALFPDVMNTPAEWRLAVTIDGDVVRVDRFDDDDARAFVSLAKRPGQVAIFNAGRLARDARAAIERRECAA